VPSLVLAGGVELQEKHYATAESMLQRAIDSRRSTAAHARRSRSYLASGQPARAVDVMQPLLGRNTRIDAATLMLAGEAHFANGDIAVGPIL
jgi:uncharacterized protein HemY